HMAALDARPWGTQWKARAVVGLKAQAFAQVDVGMLAVAFDTAPHAAHAGRSLAIGHAAQEFFLRNRGRWCCAVQAAGHNPGLGPGAGLRVSDGARCPGGQALRAISAEVARSASSAPGKTGAVQGGAALHLGAPRYGQATIAASRLCSLDLPVQPV